MKFRFIEEHRGTHSVGKMARVLGISRSGYYSWRCRSHSEREQSQKRLKEEISLIQEQVKHRYGSPRVTEELRRRGYRVGHNRIARIMRENLLGRRARKRFRSTTNSEHGLEVAENLLDRKFDVAAANRVWVSDISYVATSEGWLYLCVVIDLYSRKVVGWSMSSRLKTDLVLQALMMGLLRRNPPAGLIFHSDRGSQYCSHDFKKLLEKNGIHQSMSRKGDCWDNAPCESYFKTLKIELSGGGAFPSRKAASMAIFEYIEVFYNRVRLHSSLGYLTPEEYEEFGRQEIA
jgi:putative transposase